MKQEPKSETRYHYKNFANTDAPGAISKFLVGAILAGFIAMLLLVGFKDYITLDKTTSIIEKQVTLPRETNNLYVNPYEAPVVTEQLPAPEVYEPKKD